MPNVTADGKEEKGPADAPSTYPGEFAPLEVPPSLEPWVRARAAWRHPAFADVRIVDPWSCYYEMTPDDHPIVGAVPGVAGLYLAAGFRRHRVLHSPSAIERLDLAGRRVVQRTSSGTQGVVAATKAGAIVLGSFVIASATVRYLRERAREVTVVAMGQNALEDADEDLACARYLAA